MKLTLKRKFLSYKHTIGDLFIDEEFFCNTIEDTVRELQLLVLLPPKDNHVNVKRKSMRKLPFQLERIK